MNPVFRNFLTHFFAIAFFAVVALLYFHPVLQGKVIYQSDIVQYRGMAQEQEDFRRQFDEEPYWTNSAFGGMPTYQLGARYPDDYIKKLDRIIRFLPRPADYLFLYFLGFYILMCCMKVEYRLAILGALAFGFSTYLIIILGVGHNAKAHAIGYLPMVLGGIILTFRRNYLWGFLLTAVAVGLEIQANHYQMTFYFLFLAIPLGIVYLADAIRDKQLKAFFTSTGLLLIAALLGIAVNATSLMATREYADWSTRGPSVLTINPDGSPKADLNGLDKDYITQYSYGISESLNLLVPRLYGGGSVESLGDESRTFEFLTDQGVSRSQALDFSNNLQLYWGDQPIVAAPAYIGAVVSFLFLLGLLLVRGRARWWLMAAALIALMLSWGKNFSALTDLMIDYFPLYNKFRAVSSIQVILELCAPILAILAIRAWNDPKTPENKKRKALTISFITMLGLGVLLFISKSFFDFTGASDEVLKRYYGEELVGLIRRDREAVYLQDTFRTMVFIALTAVLLWMNLKKRLPAKWMILGLGVLIVTDLVGVDLRYVNKEDFVSRRQLGNSFAMTQADQQILQDTGYYRVLNLGEGLNGARTSYFHKSLGGYHAAKPQRLRDLFEFHIYKNNRRVLDMLNTKYIIQTDEDGNPRASVNPDALGNAWFVERVKGVSSPDQAIQALDSVLPGREAIVNTREFTDITPGTFAVDSTSRITLDSYKANALTYTSENPNAGMAVFSEMYYPQGWQVYLDGQPHTHFRVNYALRGMLVPPGTHKIEFRFEPEVIQKGSQISLASNVLLALLLLGGTGFTLLRKRRKQEA
ncbi:YfhO family protein [Robiginitalea aurantiaca]|uniref:YfhO family protein n=1 Tax=Robiginitalea aurantiaca TaxID=3056915 RepID=A0ABT7WG09_9FLAO|nr:YfhO family protein [Robiginitalea aurantiaca]MDM9631860.1 YfhO family protein [Robiginitalea aurantiaca]